jgi:hypothetical protein
MLLPVDNGVEAQQPVQEQAGPPRPPQEEPLVRPIRPNIRAVHPIWIDEPKEQAGPPKPPDPVVPPARRFDFDPLHPYRVPEPKDPALRLPPGTLYPRIGFIPGQQQFLTRAGSANLPSWVERQIMYRDMGRAHIIGLLNMGVKKSKVMAVLQKAWEGEAPVLVYEALFDLQLGLDDTLGFRF